MKLPGRGLGRSSVLLQRITDLRPGEGLRVLIAGLWFGCVMTTNYTLRPLREAMALTGGVDGLQWLFTATFVVMLAAVPIYGLAVARRGRRRLVPLVHRFFELNLLIFFLILHGIVGADDPSLRLWTARVFFVWTSVFNLFVVSLFWSVMADTFSREDAGRLFGLISVGGSIGAIAGPTIGGALALCLGPGVLPLVGAVLLELALWALRGLPGPAVTPERDGDPIGGGALAAIPEILRSPILLGLCAFILLMTASSTLLYFIQARIVAAGFVDDATRTAVFAGMDLAVNAVTLLVQTIVTGRLLGRLGLARSLAVLPIVCVLGFACLAAAPVLATLVAVQILRRACNYAVARPAREVVYTTVPRSARYKAKSLIDTVIYRGGDALTGWAFTGLTALGLGLGPVALIAAPLAGVWAVVGHAVGRRADAPGPD